MATSCKREHFPYRRHRWVKPAMANYVTWLPQTNGNASRRCRKHEIQRDSTLIYGLRRSSGDAGVRRSPSLLQIHEPRSRLRTAICRRISAQANIRHRQITMARGAVTLRPAPVRPVGKQYSIKQQGDLIASRAYLRCKHTRPRLDGKEDLSGCCGIGVVDPVNISRGMTTFDNTKKCQPSRTRIQL